MSVRGSTRARRACQRFELLGSLREGAVVYFSLQADRRPLLSQMLAAAIVQDLQTVVAACQSRPLPTLVAIDEFSALAAEGVVRLFGRARSAGFSLLLGTQEISDLRPPGRERVLEQVMGNLTVLIAHRQVVRDSAELIAGLAGSAGAWRVSRHSDGPQHAHPHAPAAARCGGCDAARAGPRRGDRTGRQHGRASSRACSRRHVKPTRREADDARQQQQRQDTFRDAPGAGALDGAGRCRDGRVAGAARRRGCEQRTRAAAARPLAAACCAASRPLKDAPALFVATAAGMRAAGLLGIEPRG